jgi:hypothetical protein
LKTSVVVNIFNTVVLSIILFGAEIWIPCLSQNDLERIERFYLKNLKRILGVPLSTANSAVYYELNQTSIEVILEHKILEFFCRIKLDKVSWPILIDTLKLDNKWAAYCNKILNTYDIPIHLLHESIIPYADILQKFQNKITSDLSSMSSLKFLNSLSKETDTLKLLDSISIKNHRTALSRLRCGNFNIRLRTGTWNNEPRDLRTCRFCDSNEIEDETHILLRCEHFSKLRLSLIDKINQDENGVFVASASELHLDSIMNSENLLPLLAKFVHNISMNIDQILK